MQNNCHHSQLNVQGVMLTAWLVPLPGSPARGPYCIALEAGLEGPSLKVPICYLRQFKLHGVMLTAMACAVPWRLARGFCHTALGAGLEVPSLKAHICL